MKLCEHCGIDLVGKRPEARFCCDSHRTARWKALREGTARNGFRGVTRPRPRSGAQLSYWKLHRALGVELGWSDEELHEFLLPLAPDRQRRALRSTITARLVVGGVL